MSDQKVSALCAPGETLCLVVNTQGVKGVKAFWDGNGGVQVTGRGYDGKPWKAEFHHKVGHIFEVVSVEGSTGRLRTLSPSSRGFKITAEGLLREIGAGADTEA